MDTKTLLRFAKRIISSSSTEKAKHSLRQLIELLKEQGTSEKNIALLEKMVIGLPEINVTLEDLTETEIDAAVRRKREREAREEEMRYRGRC